MKKNSQKREMECIREKIKGGIPHNNLYKFKCENECTEDDTTYRIITIFKSGEILCEGFNYRADIIDNETKNMFNIKWDKSKFNEDNRYWLAKEFYDFENENNASHELLAEEDVSLEFYNLTDFIKINVWFSKVKKINEVRNPDAEVHTSNLQQHSINM